MSIGKIFIGTLAGFTIGAIAGMLFAPEKGTKTRKQIYDKGADYADKLKSRFEELSDSFMQKVETTKKEAEELFSKGKAKFEEAKKELKNDGAKV